MTIARVFPTRTSMTPTDPDAYYEGPGLFTPKYDEVHISVAFTWDLAKADYLSREWEKTGAKVRVGGPALGDPGAEFTPGQYLQKGVTITSRGCPNRCGFCFVPKREGVLRELKIQPGNIVQDNNLLACSTAHIQKVFSMLRGQKAIVFQGGLEAVRITDQIVESLRSLRIKELWLAYDHMAQALPVERAIGKLSKYFTARQIRCFVLIGYGPSDTPEKAEARLMHAYELGTYPFAMLYKGDDGHPLSPYRAWRDLQRKWDRPAAYKTFMKEKGICQQSRQG